MKTSSKPKEKHIAEPGAGHRHAPLLNRRESRDKLVEELIKTLCALSPIGMYIVQDRKFQYINPKFQQLTGFSEAELLGADSLRLVHPEDRDTVRAGAIAMLKGKRTSPYEYRVSNKAGKIRYIVETIASIQYRRRQATLGNYMDVTEHKRAEHDLSERIKELNTLYHIGDIAQRPGITLDELFQKVTNLLPTGWQYPEITCARITIDDREFRSKNYRETGWKQSSDITVLGAKVGTVEVGYLEERPAIDEGPFSKEERQLINAIAEQLGRITERKQAEEELKNSEERLRILFESAPDAYYLNDLKGNFVDGNKMAEEMTGYEKSELIGKNFLKLNLLPAKQILKAAALLAKNARGQPTGPDEFVLKRKDGSSFVAEIRTFPVKIKGEALVLGIARDITERKRAEERIQHLNLILQAIRNVNQLISREKNRSRLLEGICHSLTETRGYYSAWIALFDESGGYVTAAEAGLSRGFRPMIERLKRGQLPDCAQRVLKQSDIMVIEDPLSTCADCPLSSQLPQKRGAMTARLAHDGKVYGLLSVSMPTEFVSDEEEYSLFQELTGDISFALHSMELEDKRRRAEEALRESEENFRLLAENSIDGISITNFLEKDAGRRLYWNKRLAELTGYTMDEMALLQFIDIIHPDERERVADIRRKRLARKPAPKRYETMFLRKDGTTVHVEVTVANTIWQGQPAMITFFRDITERRQAEEALRESEERYRDLFENANDLIQSVTPDGRFIYVNKTWRKVLGYTEAEITNLTLWDIIHPDYIRHCQEIFQKLISGETADNVEAVFVAKDGRSVPVEGHASCRFEEGKPVATRGIFRDITERKRAEEARCEIDRLKSEFISNISHELRSPLHSIRGFSNLMLEGKVPDPETQKEFLTIIDRQSEHLSSLVDNLLDTSRLEAGQFSIQKRLTQIENIIHSAVETFYTLTDEKGIIVTEDIPPALPQIEVDAERLKQVMMNLLSNAIKFTEDAGPVTVKVEARDGELLVQVADRGIGISEEAMPRLFERFQQAGQASRIGGAGLGLYISRQIIEAHGGRIWAKSKEGKGSTFYFTLPLEQEGGNSDE